MVIQSDPAMAVCWFDMMKMTFGEIGSVVVVFAFYNFNLPRRNLMLNDLQLYG